MSARNDCHRTSEVVPEHYRHLFSFSYPTPGDGHGFNMRRILELEGQTVKSPTNGGCAFCGAHFIHGDALRHEPTGRVVLVGNICADRLGFTVNRADWLAWRKKVEAEKKLAKKLGLKKKRREAAQAAVLARCPEALELLAMDHHIARNMRQGFESHGFLSEKQVAFLRKLKGEAAAKALAPVIAKAEAPIGVQTVRGRVLKARLDFGPYGETVKMLVLVTNPDGAEWKCWGTCPARFLDEVGQGELKNAEVEFKAEFKRSDEDASFAFYRKPKALAIDFPKREEA